MKGMRSKYAVSESFPFDIRKWPFFYGYVIVISSTLGIIFSAPGQTIGVSVFTDYLIENLKIDRLQLSLAYMVGTTTSALIIMRAGRLLDTIGVRPVSFITAILFGLMLGYMSQVDRLATVVGNLFRLNASGILSFIMVTIGFFCIRFLGQGVLTLAGRTMLMRWFIERRGRINSITGAVVALIFAGSPLVFEQMIQNYGWRGAWIILGIIIGVFFSLYILVFYREKPEDSGLVPDSIKPLKDAAKIPVVEENWVLPQVRRTYTFWVFNLGLSMFALVFTAITFHIVSIFKVAGLSRMEAISIFLPASVIAVVINLSSGWLIDWKPFQYRLKYLLAFLLSGLILSSTGVLLLASGIGKYLIITGNGMASGLYASLSTVTWPRFFGREHLGEISGFNMAFMVFFSAIGPSILGWSFDRSGNYETAIWFCLLAGAILLLMSFKADKPEIERLNKK